MPCVNRKDHSAVGTYPGTLQNMNTSCRSPSCPNTKTRGEEVWQVLSPVPVFIGCHTEQSAGSALLSQELLAAGGTTEGGHTNVRLTGTAAERPESTQ